MTMIKTQPLEFIRLEAGLRIDREANVLYGAQVAKLGEAEGHGFFLDGITLDQIVKLGNAAQNGVKARFGHPTACTPALGTVLGVRKNFVRDGDFVRADLHITNVANPEYARHIFEMASLHPEKIGSSVVVEGTTELRRDNEGKPLVDEHGRKLPPVLRVKRLRAVDVVDEPAAGNGMFAEPIDGVDLSSKTILDLRNAMEQPGFTERAIDFLLGRQKFSDAENPNQADTEVSEQEADMSLTLSDFKEKYPGVAQEHATELSVNHTESLATATEAGVKQERGRITKLLSRAKPHHFASTKEFSKGFVVHALEEGLSNEAVLEGLMDLDATATELSNKAGALALLEEASEDIPVESAAPADKKLSKEDSALAAMANARKNREDK